MLHSYDDLLTYLRSQGAACTESRPHHSVELPTHSPPVEGALVIMWNPELHLVQLLHTVPIPVPPERVSAVEGALLRVNHALALPGFGFNYRTSRVYFRRVLTRQPDGDIAEEEISRAANTVIATLRDFWLPLRAIIVEGAAPETILPTKSRD